MARKETFSETVTFETTGTGDGGSGGGEDVPTVFLSSAELNQTPDPGQRVTLEVALGADESVGNAWYEATIDGRVVSEFDGIEIEPDRDGTRSTIITAPDADTFDVQIRGGPDV